MICPHCEQSLLRRERPGNVCGKCGRRYALDPKTNPMKLNDLRVRRVAAKVTQDGQVPCTVGQLWYALSRRSLRDTQVDLGCAGALTVAGLIVTFVGLATAAVVAVVGGLLLAGALGFVAAEVMGVGRGRPRLDRDSFRTGPMADWRHVYGALPPGVLDDGRYPSPPAGQPESAGADTPGGPLLVCPDRSVAVFLDAMGLPARYGLTLVAAPDTLVSRTPAPVLVLHDADARGLGLVHRVRAARPGRPVFDLGLPLDAVYGKANAVPVRGEPPTASAMEPLERSGEFGADQLRWLRQGWGFPLVAVAPAKLLDAVTRAVERVGALTDPERRRAASVGFLTWPDGGTT
ncbi:hypothetical protein [Streptomyces flavalbus]|uniref:Uncharacterized protein n=1 Tax=Streptomyces flavalbus TaxID=2665155 RepID=A0ABW2VZU0_9ACTN